MTTPPLTADDLAKDSTINHAQSQAKDDSESQSDFARLTDSSQLPQPKQPPINQATFKSCPAHFIVNEQLDISFTGEGEHLWLLIKKMGMNTAYAARLLADWAEIPPRDIGYSGLKDRQAVTTQWFSLRLPKRTPPNSQFAPSLKSHESIELLDQHWHNKKLSRGTHNFNRFTITLTAAEYHSRTSLESRLQSLATTGVPNYFGTQRFGHGGNNIKNALKWFNDAAKTSSTPSSQGRGSRRISKRQREQHSMMLSAARSLIFNHILAERVSNGTWDKALTGEVVNLAGTGSIFVATDVDDQLTQRLQSGDIHPTAVMWGEHNDQVQDEAGRLEQRVVDHHPLLSQLAAGLKAQGIKAQRRPLRVIPQRLTWQWLNDSDLKLSFTLPTGSYATGVLYSIVADLREGETSKKIR